MYKQSKMSVEISIHQRPSTSSHTATAQAVVVGAGPAGSATASALAQCGVDVLLLDKAAFPRDKTCGDGLTPRSVAVLQEMGLLPRLETAGARRISGIRIVAPAGCFVEVGFDELAGKLPPFSLTLPRRTLDALLLEHAQAAGARFMSRFRVQELVYKNGVIAGVQGIHKGEAALVHAPLTCLATGAAVLLVQKAGLLPTVPPPMRAARSYFGGLTELEPIFQFHFDRNLIPGYGWIFPLAGGRANVGVGCFPGRQFRPSPPRRPYEQFINQNPLVGQQLTKATSDGPVKSYPLRTGFLSVKQTQRDGLLLVGEAAGLVNPLTGEGVDYALESGLMAAEVAAGALGEDTFSAGRLAVYGRRLHQRYGALFYYLTKMRQWYIRERVLNTVIRKAQYRPRLKYMFAHAALGLIDPKEGISLRTLRDIAF